MNSFNSYWLKAKRGLYASLVAVVVMSCGTETALVNTAGISGTGVVFGTITGFGSIFVNGVEYEIDDATFDVDGNKLATQEQLRIGMVVRLDATNNDDGITGVATSVFYDDSIEGPVTTSPVSPVGKSEVKEFSVMGQMISVNASTIFEGVSFDTLALNDVVEISGFPDESGTIFATRIEKKGSFTGAEVEVELHGVIADLNLVPNQFKIGSLIIDISKPPVLDDISGGLANGLNVKVKGRYQSNGSIIADEVEGEDGDNNNGDGDLSLHGLVTSFVNGVLKVNGTTVDTSAISTATLNLITQGIEVEVHGTLSNGVLVATRIEIRSAEARFDANITAVDTANKTIGVSYPNINGTVTLTVNAQSQMIDETQSNAPLTISGLNDSMQARIEARKSGDNWVVTSLKRKDLQNEYEIKGIVSAKTANTSLTVNGLVINLSPTASYKIDNVGKSAADFFSAVVLGTTKVELEDSDGDGQFDEAEISN